MAGVLVVGDVGEGHLAGASLQLATVGANIAQQRGEPLIGALIGARVEQAADEFQCGLTALYLVEGEHYRPYTALACVAAGEALVKATAASVVLFAHGADTRDWVPMLAARVDAAVVLDCTTVAIDGDAVVVTKPVNGGGVCAELVMRGKPCIATVRASAFSPRGPGARVEPTRLDVAFSSDERVTVLSEERPPASGRPRLRDARIVVAGGRGIGGPGEWHFIEEASEALGAAVGCSRPVADAGWVASSHQVGLSGVSVAADLYIAIGISGAPQHLSGITGARTVVAINNSPDADIFTRADYGVVGDYRDVLPAFIERVKQLRS